MLLSSGGSVARAAEPAASVEHLLVHFAAGTTEEERSAAAALIGGRIEGEIAALGVTRIAVPLERGWSAADLKRQAAALPRVRAVEQDARVHLDFAPNDPLWTTDPWFGLGQWGPKKIQLDRALDLVKDLAPVTVAVIDTGVDTGHPDLAGALLPGITLLSGQSAACNADQIATDDNSHGTHVAGIIAAVQNNNVGIAGAAPNAKVLPIKALDCTGSGVVSDIAQGITYAVDHGARVVSISLGSSSDSPTLAAAVQYAIARNVLIVAAVGNCGVLATRCFNTLNLVEYPGAYPGVLGAGATQLDDTIASFSTQGSQVGVAAPGVRIVSTTPRYPTYQSDRGGTMNYAAFSGTSQATPLVAGVAALLMGIDPTLTAQQVADRLKTTADDLGTPGTDVAFGAGRINALRAVTATVPSYAAKYDTTAVPTSATAGVAFAAKVTLTNTSQGAWNAGGPNPVRLAYHWLDANGNVAVWDGQRTILPADVAPGSSVTLTAIVTAPPTRGTYTLRFDLVKEGVTWFSARGVKGGDVAITVGSGLGASYVTQATTATFFTASPSPLAVTLTNTGTRPWSASGAQQMRLSYHWLQSGATIVWDGARGPAFPADVLPGQTVTVQLPVAAPPALGSYTLRLDLVQEGVSWFSGEGVATRDITYAVTSGYSASYTPAPPGMTLLPGTRVALGTAVRNDGVVAWSAAGTTPVHLAAHVSDASGNTVLWDGARTVLTADLAPGASGTYAVTLDAPLAPGAYRARVDAVQEGVTWFSGLGIATGDTPFTVVADYRAQIALAATAQVSRTALTLPITLTNPTGTVWNATGPYPVHVATHWYDAAGNTLLWDGPRTNLPRDIGGGQSVPLTIAVAAPPVGAVSLGIDLVSEGVRWFGVNQRASVVLLP